MRFPLLALLTASTCIASADRLINAPTGRKIPYGAIRFETFGELSRTRTQEFYLGIGIGRSFDLDLHSQRFMGEDAVQTFDLGYNFVAPIPGFTPGISFGVQDVMNKTDDGRRPYMAVTFRPTFMTINGDFPADITLGTYIAANRSVFVSGSLPFSKEFRFLFEHNGFRLASGFEVRPMPEFAIRLLYRGNDVLGGVMLSKGF